MSRTRIEKKLRKVKSEIYALDRAEHWSQKDYKRYDWLMLSMLELEELLEKAS